MKCILSIEYMLKINGSMVGSFQAFKGLKQKDLPSSFLFLTCNKGLSSLLRLAMHEKRVFGKKVIRFAHKFLTYFLQGIMLMFYKEF